MFDVSICTCIYNRTWTLPHYMKSLLETTKGCYHLLFILNYDNNFPHDLALERFEKEMKPFGKNYDLYIVPNCGLKGFNYGIEAGKHYKCPVMLCNDDTVFGQDWERWLLNTEISKVNRDGQDVEIDPNSVGVVAPCYFDPGCMKHQRYNSMDEHNYSQHYFVVGHAQVITKAALDKHFEFKDEYCTKYGPFDLYQATMMQYLGLNQIVARRTCFSFPNDKESHFHDGDPGKFTHLTGQWAEMENNVKQLKQDVIRKWGSDKWAF